MATKKDKSHEGNVIEKSRIEPFTIGKQIDKYFILVGDKLVTRKSFNTKKEAEDYLLRKPYDVIFNSMLAMIQILKENEEYEKKQTKVSTTDGEMVVPSVVNA